MVIDDIRFLNVSVETVMPRILNGTKHVAVCTCGEDFRVLVTVDFAEATFDKTDK
jgi:hypothetical protein